MTETPRKRRRGRGASADPPQPLPQPRRLYDGLFSADELAALNTAADGDDLGEELRLLRVMIRRAVASDTEMADLDVLSKSIGRLAQAQRVQHVLKGDSARTLDEALAKVLEEIGNELSPG